VEFNRVNGNLALSRALGDFVFKRNEKKSAKDQIVTAFPDVQSRDVTEELEFIVIACDGIWDVLSNEEVIEFIRRRIADEMEPSVICEELMTRCLAPGCQMGGLGCDNMTVILICFLNGKPYKELSAKCRRSPFNLNQKSSEVDDQHPDADVVVVKTGIEDEEETTGIADSPDSNISTSSSSCSSHSSSSSSGSSSTETPEPQIDTQRKEGVQTVTSSTSSPAPAPPQHPQQQVDVPADSVIEAVPEVQKSQTVGSEQDLDQSPQSERTVS
jgi:hypothetical protein